jgi:hypothetical protein
VKLQWRPKKSMEAQFDRCVRRFQIHASVMEKDSEKYPKTGVGDTRYSCGRLLPNNNRYLSTIDSTGRSADDDVLEHSKRRPIETKSAAMLICRPEGFKAALPEGAYRLPQAALEQADASQSKAKLFLEAD